MTVCSDESSPSMDIPTIWRWNRGVSPWCQGNLVGVSPCLLVIRMTFPIEPGNTCAVMLQDNIQLDVSSRQSSEVGTRICTKDDRWLTWLYSNDCIFLFISSNYNETEVAISGDSCQAKKKILASFSVKPMQLPGSGISIGVIRLVLNVNENASVNWFKKESQH